MCTIPYTCRGAVCLHLHVLDTYVPRSRVVMFPFQSVARRPFMFHNLWAVAFLLQTRLSEQQAAFAARSRAAEAQEVTSRTESTSSGGGGGSASGGGGGSSNGLPPGWEARQTEDGRTYYASHTLKITQSVATSSPNNLLTFTTLFMFER